MKVGAAIPCFAPLYADSVVARSRLCLKSCCCFSNPFQGTIGGKNECDDAGYCYCKSVDRVMGKNCGYCSPGNTRFLLSKNHVYKNRFLQNKEHAKNMPSLNFDKKIRTIQPHALRIRTSGGRKRILSLISPSTCCCSFKERNTANYTAEHLCKETFIQ